HLALGRVVEVGGRRGGSDGCWRRGVKEDGVDQRVGVRPEVRPRMITFPFSAQTMYSPIVPESVSLSRSAPVVNEEAPTQPRPPDRTETRIPRWSRGARPPSPWLRSLSRNHLPGRSISSPRSGPRSPVPGQDKPAAHNGGNDPAGPRDSST